MSNSSDSELELAQRSQSGSKISGSGQETEVNDKSPWDMMKSKQNKAFSKNYLQEIMNLDESNADVLKTIQLSNKKRAPDVNDAKSPGVSKKVSFSEHVQKREIIVSSSSSSDEESAKDSNKNVRKGILKRKNIDLEDSASTSDDGSIQSHANKLRQRKLLDGQGSSSESKKNSMLMCNEKSKFTVTKKKRDEKKLSSQSDSDVATTSLTNKRINHIKNIKKETTESQSDVSSDDDDDEESVDQNRNPSFNRNVSINSNKELSESTDSDNSEGRKKKVRLSHNSKHTLSKVPKHQKSMNYQSSDDDEEENTTKIPKDLDPKLLVSGVINFNGESSKLEINENVYALHVNMDKNISNVLIDSSDNGDSFNILSLKCHGVISISKDTKIRKKSLKIKKYQQDDEVIEEPKNLKEQHLLLGHNYEDRINLDKWISDKLEGLITDFNKKRKQKRRSKSFNENKTPVEEENLDIFKLLDEHTDRKSSEENECSMMMENNDNVDKTSLKKRSRSKSIFEEENSSPAKRKRSKSLSTVNPEDFDDTIPGDSTPIKSKKNKKSKTSLEHIVKEEMVSEDEFSLNKHKKAIVNSTMISVKEDNSIFDNEESFIPKPNDSSINRFIDDLVKEVEDKKKKVDILKLTIERGRYDPQQMFNVDEPHTGK
nr:uncharacterized protein LOC111427122 [Onthophagus taurus]